MSKKIDVELLRAMMMGDYSPQDKDDLKEDWVTNDLHSKTKSKDNFQTLTNQLRKCEKVIDKAILQNKKQVAVIHGKGNAVLKKEIEILLQKHPQVKRFEQQKDNSGATIVYFY